MENLTPEQNQALSVAYESCTSKTAFGHPSDPTFTMEVAERTELDEKLVKAWFRVSNFEGTVFTTVSAAEKSNSNSTEKWQVS